MLPVHPNTISRSAARIGGDNAVGGLSVFGLVCARVGRTESEKGGEIGDCALDFWWWVWYFPGMAASAEVDVLVLGMKELYGGGLFVRESNNTVIFVRSSYRVSLYF